MEKKSLIELLSQPLANEDIEFRIGSVQKGDNPKGFSLLAYKTARTDVKRLNDVMGLNWKNRYQYDNKGILCCEISIYNEMTNEWISRIDVGTESNTEKEKGSYSDAFKRAGFKWGIGLELYKFPFIWINWNEWSDWNGKKSPKNFSANDVEVQEYIYKDGEIVKLILKHKKQVIFEKGKQIKVETEEVVPEPKISDEQVVELEGLIAEHGRDRSKFLSYIKIKDLGELNLSNYEAVKKLITAPKK